MFREGIFTLIRALPFASAFFPARRKISHNFAMMSADNSRNLPIIEPELFKRFKLTEQPELTKICQSLRSLERVRICEEPVLEAWFTTSGQSFLDGKFCPDVLFVRSFYEQLFQTIRLNRNVALLGNPGNCKTV